MLTFYKLCGQIQCTSCALYYRNDRYSHHNLYLYNLHHMYACFFFFFFFEVHAVCFSSGAEMRGF